jgi:Acetyltransferase (GNAT) domain/Methyltransferase domain
MYEQLSFPLNVYAKILELNNAPVNYLHFGLFEKIDDDVYQAQQRSTEKILKFLPPAPASILEIGIGLGTTQKILLDKGYSAEGVTPDSAQIDIAKNRIGACAKLYCSKFEDFNTDSLFDIILTQESAQYLDLLHLIPKASQLLKQNGYFILIDEVSLKRDNLDLTSLHQPEHIKFIAKCCGLELKHEEALGNEAKYTMTYLLNGLNNHWHEILSTIEQNQDQLTKLKKAIKDYIKKYEQGNYGYQFLVFQKLPASEIHSINGLTYLNESHFSAFQHLFNDAFSINMSKTLWDWKYHQTLSYSLGYWEDNKLIGHYGGFSRDILLFGEKTTALQIGDTMVASHKRAIFTKNGIFHQLARSFLYCFIGYGTPHQIGFGFPNKRVMSLAEKLGLYTKVGQFTRLSWQTTKKQKASLIYKVRSVSVDDSNEINHLWHNMSTATRQYIIGTRDWQRFNYRYNNHPEHDYQMLKINNRFTQKIIAVFVLKFETDHAFLVDLICEPKYIKQVINAALRVSKDHQKAQMITLISDNLLTLFSHYQFEQSDPEIAIPHSACTSGEDPEKITNSWWLMAGDSDFI